jgi:hypothetical protein
MEREETQLAYWTPETIWSGGVCFIIGGGPSLRGFDWTALRDRHVVGCNDAFGLGDWVEVVVFGDNCWYRDHRVGLKHYRGLKVCGSTNGPAPDEGIRWVRRERDGLCGWGPYDRNRLGWNWSTGAMAINLALKLGATTVVLLGFDMKLAANGDCNWHPNTINSADARVYERMTAGMGRIASDLPRVFPGARVVNAGPDSALTVFPMVTMKEALRYEA